MKGQCPSCRQESVIIDNGEYFKTVCDHCFFEAPIGILFDGDIAVPFEREELVLLIESLVNAGWAQGRQRRHLLARLMLAASVMRQVAAQR